MFVAGDIRREASCLVRRGGFGVSKGKAVPRPSVGQGAEGLGAKVCSRGGGPLLPGGLSFVATVAQVCPAGPSGRSSRGGVQRQEKPFVRWLWGGGGRGAGVSFFP